MIFSALNGHYLGLKILIIWFEWFVGNLVKSGHINILGNFRKIIFIFVHCVMVYWKHTLNKTIVKIWTSHFTRSENKLCIWPFSKFLGSFYEDLDIWNCPRHLRIYSLHSTKDSRKERFMCSNRVHCWYLKVNVNIYVPKLTLELTSKLSTKLFQTLSKKLFVKLPRRHLEITNFWLPFNIYSLFPKQELHLIWKQYL